MKRKIVNKNSLVDAVDHSQGVERETIPGPPVRIDQIEFVSTAELSKLRHPKNPNTHSSEQIESLAKIIEFQGWRLPIKVSRLSGFITAGHGRLDAAELRGWRDVPVSYQDYESEEQEFADLVADNAIAEWSVLDFKSINEAIPNLGPDFDIDLLGIKNFEIDVADKKQVSFEASEGNQFIVSIHCANEGQMKELYNEMRERGLDCKLIT